MNVFVPGVPREGRHQQNEIIYFLYSVFLFPRVIKCTNTQVQSVDAKPGTSVDPYSYSFYCVFESTTSWTRNFWRGSHIMKSCRLLFLCFSPSRTCSLDCVTVNSLSSDTSLKRTLAVGPCRTSVNHLLHLPPRWTSL